MGFSAEFQEVWRIENFGYILLSEFAISGFCGNPPVEIAFES